MKFTDAIVAALKLPKGRTDVVVFDEPAPRPRGETKGQREGTVDNRDMGSSMPRRRQVAAL